MNQFQNAYDPARRRRPHRGQARASFRKRENQAARRTELKKAAKAKGVDVLVIVRERQCAVEQLPAKAAADKLAAERQEGARKSPQESTKPTTLSSTSWWNT